jgi:lysophospholipase L1-like esterase
MRLFGERLCLPAREVKQIVSAMQVLYIRPRFIKRLFVCAFLLLVSLALIGKLWVPGFADSDSTWTNPTTLSLSRANGIGGAQAQPNFLSNLDCTAITYRLTDSSTMNTGCFTPTAFGMFDSDSETIIYNGTDEGLHVLPSSANQLLVPWPNAANMVALDSASTGGSYISLYKKFPAVQQYRDGSGRLSGEQLVSPPDVTLKDASGQNLVINPQTMAFSSGGGWLVAEDYNDSFVRINLASLQMTAFAPAFNNPISQKSQVAVSQDGRFVAIQNLVNGSFRVYDVSACDGVVNNLAAQPCPSYEYWPFIDHRIDGLQSIQHVRFLNDSLLSFDAMSTSPVAAGTYELSLTPDDSLTGYLGLGDSYTSGEGAFDYLEGTDSGENKCHVSVNSYPLLLTRDLFNGSGGHSVACSGAVIRDVDSDSDDYRGQVKNGSTYTELANSKALLDITDSFLPGYIAQQRFVRQYQPKTITVSVGGNDIGFGDILQDCVEPHLSLKPHGQDCYSSYESRQAILQLVDRAVPRWTALYKQLQAEDPPARVYALGYPSIADSGGKCGLNVHLSKSELEFADALIAYLDSDIQQAAHSAGVDYIDISQALEGHRLCEASGYDIAVNGLTAGNDVGFAGIEVLGHESFHPNALGQQLVEQAILRQTANLSQAHTDGVPPASDPSSLLNAPKTGATIYALVPDDHLTKTVLRAGSSTQIKVDGLSIGLAANSPYAIGLDGPTGQILATAGSDDQAAIDAGFIIPKDLPPGGTTIDITGTSKTGEPVDVTQPVYITSTDGDSDGDGLPDASDSCPYAINSGQDSDDDGIDDGCDSSIGPPLGNNSGGAGKESSLSGFKVSASGPQSVRPLAIGRVSVNGPAVTGLTSKPSDESVLGVAQTLQPPKHYKSGINSSVVKLEDSAAHGQISRFEYAFGGLSLVIGLGSLAAGWFRKR